MNTFHDTVTATLDTLTAGLRPFVRSQLQSVYGENWLAEARKSFQKDRSHTDLDDDIEHWDTHALLTIMWDQWNSVFRRNLNLFERSLVAELRAFRNRWAHQGEFNFDDTYRLLDSVQRLLSKVHAPNVSMISELKFELLREEFGDAINATARRTEDNRERWVVAFVYMMCGLVFLWLLPTTIGPLLGKLVWAPTVAIAMGFGYLIYQRIRYRPVILGPHECRRCRRIVYGTGCPYCASPQVFDSAEFRSADVDEEEAEAERPRMPR
ncbi:MAG: Swt1 family HEPN domain-containing protein [Planctomycetota bacterium]|nr:Swt1 family HEPN domain-containing protein [Planctomycetota bacterium]